MNAVIRLALVLSVAVSVFPAVTACPSEIVLGDSAAGMAVAMDLLRWEQYWLIGYSQSTSSEGFAYRFEKDQEIGYCRIANSECLLYEWSDGELLRKGAFRFEPERAEQSIASNLSLRAHERAKVQRPSGEAPAAQAGIRGIEDPVKRVEYGRKEDASVSMGSAKICQISIPGVEKLRPRALRSDEYPTKLPQLLTAMQQQGLTANGARIEVPKFSDRDSSVLFAIRSAAGQRSLLIANFRARGWIDFRPASDLGLRDGDERVLGLIEQNASISLRELEALP